MLCSVISSIVGVVDLEARVAGLAVARIERRADTDAESLAGSMLMEVLQRHGPVGWCDAASGISSSGEELTAMAGAIEDSPQLASSPSADTGDGGGNCVDVDGAVGFDAPAGPTSVKEIVESLGVAEKEMLVTQTDRVSNKYPRLLMFHRIS